MWPIIITNRFIDEYQMRREGNAKQTKIWYFRRPEFPFFPSRRYLIKWNDTDETLAWLFRALGDSNMLAGAQKRSRGMSSGKGKQNSKDTNWLEINWQTFEINLCLFSLLVITVRGWLFFDSFNCYFLETFDLGTILVIRADFLKILSCLFWLNYSASFPCSTFPTNSRRKMVKSSSW